MHNAKRKSIIVAQRFIIASKVESEVDLEITI